MPKERNYGDDLLVSTSVHLRVGSLKAIKELCGGGVGTSRFIREAVEAAVEKHLGLGYIIERLKAERDNLNSRLLNLDSQIDRLEASYAEQEKMSLTERRKELITSAIKNVSTYTKPEDVLTDLYKDLDIKDHKEERFVLAEIDKIWRQIRGSEV